jgi:hypothetical protein
MTETLRCEWVRCGKGCGGCPHGPYWYAYWREGGKVKKRYVGKGDPRTHAPDPPPELPPRPDRLDAIFCDRSASIAIAAEILGVRVGAPHAEAKAAYRRLSLELHPDRVVGGSARPMMRLNSAWAYWRRYYRV